MMIGMKYHILVVELTGRGYLASQKVIPLKYQKVTPLKYYLFYYYTYHKHFLVISFSMMQEFSMIQDDKEFVLILKGINYSLKILVLGYTFHAIFMNFA